MKHLLYSTVILLYITACSPYRTIERHPERFAYLFPCDTITRIEEKKIEVRVPGDSIFYDKYIVKDSIIHDTIIKNNTRLVISYANGKLHAEARCKDTVFIYKYRDTTTVRSIDRRAIFKNSIPSKNQITLGIIAAIMMILFFIYFRRTK